MTRKAKVIVAVEIKENKELFVIANFNKNKYSGYLKEVEEYNFS